MQGNFQPNLTQSLIFQQANPTRPDPKEMPIFTVFTRFLLHLKEERETPTFRERMLVKVLCVASTGLLCFSLFRTLLATLLAFGAYKGVTVAFPRFTCLGPLSIAHAYAQYRQVDTIMDSIIRMGIDPITIPLMLASVLLLLSLFNYWLFNMIDTSVVLILQELEILIGQVRVEGREPFETINWRQLVKSPGDVFRDKLGYLRCLATGKECTLRRHPTDTPISLFQYLTARNQTRLLFLTYLHEITLIGGYFGIFGKSNAYLQV